MKIVGKALLVGACLLWSASAQAGAQDFQLLNETGYQIDYVYLSAVDEQDWEEDVMGEDALPTGEAVDIEFAGGDDRCLWDLKAIYNDGDEAVWGGIDLCRIARITLYYNSSEARTWAVTE
ncbi:MAG: hypothetical protein WD100_10635 [Tistlia sp.]|uniref:hypothetical protein n=1 Tax=Tistlia sp. TaxID=3057121 RepID=UPI0034A3D076